MPNPLTTEVESRLGAAYISLMALFFIGLIFIALKNFNTDVGILEADQTRVKTISGTERRLIENWVKDNSVEVPEGEGYRYLIRKYPDKPWIR
jgi:hypothetical protein